MGCGIINADHIGEVLCLQLSLHDFAAHQKPKIALQGVDNVRGTEIDMACNLGCAKLTRNTTARREHPPALPQERVHRAIGEHRRGLKSRIFGYA